MSGITGPTTHLPGDIIVSPSGTMCDDHPDRLAVKRVIGETDSFGCEYYDLCQECYDESKTQKDDDTSTCDWCKSHNVPVKPKRDYEEGLCGPVYYVCNTCSDRYNAAIAREDDYYYD